MGPKTTQDFWSNWPPKLTLEVVPLKCVSRQQKTPLWVPISTVFSSKMQMDVGEKRSTTATVKIMSGENWRELRPCGYPSSLREAAAHGAQFTASQETTARNCREFRPCQRLFFVHRPHSTPSMQIPFFPKGSGRTVHSEPRNYSQKLPRVPSM